MQFFFVLCSAIAATSLASEFYFTQAPSSVPGNFTVWKYDTSTKKADKISTGSEGYYTGYDFVSGAAICGNNYYASAVEAMIAWGLLVTDVTTGESKIFDSKLFGNRLFHNMWCDPKDPTGNSLYVIENAPNDPNDNDFYLFHLKINGDDLTNTQIGVFSPAGYWTGSDAMFQATEDVKEVWAGWSNKAQNGGKIQVMYVATGKISEYEINGFEEGWPYTLFPLKSGVNTATGMLQNHKQHKYPFTATFDLSGDSAKISNTKEADYGYIGAEPWALEYANALAHGVITNVQGPEYGTIQTLDAKSGALVSKLTMAEIFNEAPGKTYKCGSLAVRN